MAFLSPVPLRAAGQQTARGCSSSRTCLAPTAVLRKGLFSGQVFNDDTNPSESLPPSTPPAFSSSQPPPPPSPSPPSAAQTVTEPPAAPPPPRARTYDPLSVAPPFSRDPLRETAAYVDFLPPLRSDPASRLLRLLTTSPTQTLFETPPVAFMYERGWRRQFRAAGFPGARKEASLAVDHVGRTGTLLDVSCATGVLTRELAAAGSFDAIVGLDASEAMLREAFSREGAGVFARVRADAADMPFDDGGFDAVTAGAALHCWPRVQDAIAEVRRVLKEGGGFFATTFLVGAYNPLGRVGGRWGSGGPYRFFEREELYWLCKAAGFEKVEVQEMGGCAIVRCVK